MNETKSHSYISEYMKVTKQYDKTGVWKEYTIRAKDQALLWKDFYGDDHIATDPEEAERQMSSIWSKMLGAMED